MSILARLVPSFDGPRRPSPYFYIPPKQRWWPFLTAFAAGGISVLVLFGPSTQSDADANRKTIVSRVQKPRIEPAPNTSKPSKAPAQLMTAERSDAAKGSSVAATTADATRHHRPPRL